MLAENHFNCCSCLGFRMCRVKRLAASPRLALPFSCLNSDAPTSIHQAQRSLKVTMTQDIILQFSCSVLEVSLPSIVSILAISSASYGAPSPQKSQRAFLGCKSARGGQRRGESALKAQGSMRMRRGDPAGAEDYLSSCCRA